MDKFSFGDVVRWTAKVEGEQPVKRRGVIVATVPPGADPLQHIPKGFSSKTIDNKSRKDHESYIVLVGQRIFWPAVGKLKLNVDGEEED